MAKKIAIPTCESMIDDHFGHCAYYTVFTLDEQNQVIYQERLDSPEGVVASRILLLSCRRWESP